MSKKVIRIDRSPMNATRWCLQLECRHEEWITAKRKPATKKIVCQICEPKIKAGKV